MSNAKFLNRGNNSKVAKAVINNAITSFTILIVHSCAPILYWAIGSIPVMKFNSNAPSAAKIAAGTAKFITRLSTTKTVWYVQVQGEIIPCIYHKRTKGIVTFCNNKWVRDLIKLAKQRVERLARKQGDISERVIKRITVKNAVAIG